MRRVLLAGVSLTVTACAMSTSPPPSAVSKRSTDPSPYVLALADSPAQCTLWRKAAGQRQCLDGAAPQVAAAATEPPPVAAPRMAVTARPLDAAAAPPDPTAHQANLFEEMRRIGMIKASEPMPAVAAPSDVLPRLPDPGAAALADQPRPAPAMAAVVSPPARTKALAFASTEPVALQPARAGAPPRVSSTVTQSWSAVEPPKLVQVAASTPQAHDTVGRAPVTAVEKAPLPLPAVRNDTVVPLKITERATEAKPAVVVPAAPPSAQLAQGASTTAPGLPALPSLPPLPSAAAASQPAVPSPAPVAASTAPTLPTPVQPAKPAPVAATALPVPPPPAAPPSTAVEPPPAKASPLARAFANPSPDAKPAAAKPTAPAREAKAATRGMPKSAAASPDGGRYLVLQSFQDRERADRLAERYRKFDARVAPVTIKGQTWHRVVVRDGASERNRLASDGVRGFWPITL